MIELPPSFLKIAEIVRAGATTPREIAAEAHLSEVRVRNVLRDIGDMLGVDRCVRVGHTRGCDTNNVLDAVRRAEGFVARVRERDSRNKLGRDDLPREQPGVQWPNYAPHELRFRVQGELA